MKPSPTPPREFLCLGEGLTMRCPDHVGQCAECKATEERERTGKPPAEKGEADE